MRDNIPFDVWHPIIRQVYDDADLDKLDDSPYALSPLHQRLLVHRNISLVSPTFHSLSRSVFMEELELQSPESLLSVARLVKSDRHMARIPRSIEFSFHDYRCGASSPRRKRQLKPVARPNILSDSESGSGSGPNQTESHLVHPRISPEQRAYRHYSPSKVRQPQHWIAWCGFVGAILRECTGVSSVSIHAMADYSNYQRRPNARAYATLFGSLNLDNKTILEALMACSNLRFLHLYDPSPLVDYGPALQQWDSLKELDITLSPDYPESSALSDTVFLPPRHLERFILVDQTRKHPDWPLYSAIGGCTNMLYLHLGVLDLSNEHTFGAVKFLIMTYSHTLEQLVLEIKRGAPLFNNATEEQQFPPHDITFLFNNGNMHFPKLQALRVHGGSCQTSLFARMKTDALEMVEVHELFTDDPTANEEEYWTTFLTQPNLAHIRTFSVINMASWCQEAFEDAREALDIVDFGDWPDA